MKQLQMKFVLMFLICWAVSSFVPALAYEAKNCVTLSTRNYYAREVHNDFIVREFELCLSHTTKSISYELPPLDVPLVLAATDGATLTVVVAPINNLDEPIINAIGESVEVVLPETTELVRYQMEITVLNGSGDVIEGFVDGQVVGRILLHETRATNTNFLTVALGGLSTEWWFEADTPSNNSRIRFGLITPLTAEGEFYLSDEGWSLFVSNEPIVVLSDEWLEGGYFAIRAIFAK